MKVIKFNLHKHKVSKYGAKKAVADEITFHSIKERDYYLRLKGMKERKEIKFFLCQVPFRLPGKIKYLLDFMIFELDGSITYVDVKGFMTETARIKLAQVKDLYQINVTIV